MSINSEGTLSEDEDTELQPIGWLTHLSVAHIISR